MLMQLLYICAWMRSNTLTDAHYTTYFVCDVITSCFSGWIRTHPSQLPPPVLQYLGLGLSVRAPSSPSVTMMHLSLLSHNCLVPAPTFPFKKYVLLPTIPLCIVIQLLTSHTQMLVPSGSSVKLIVNMLLHMDSLMTLHTRTLIMQVPAKAYV